MTRTLLLALLLAVPIARPAAAFGQDVPARPLTLGDAARLGARQSAAAEVARYRATQADARVTQRRADLLPNASAYWQDGGRTFNTATFGIDFPSVPGQPALFDPNGQVLGPVRTPDVRARLSQTLFDAGAYERVKSASAAAKAMDADADNAAEQAAAAAALAYLRVQRADAQLRARLADSTLADSLLGIARDQLRAGVGVALDVTRAESQLAGIRAQIIAARNERDRSRLDLLRTLGLPLDAPVTLADSLAALPVADTLPSEPEALARALRTRPDLRAADQQYAAAERQAAAIRAERLPTVSAFGDRGFIGKTYGNLLGTYTWGIQLTLPLFDGLRREGRMEEQRAAAREVDVRRNDLRQQAAIEVRSALLDLASAREQVAASRERLRLAELEVAQARERFRAGVAGNADVITASLALTGARTQLNDALTAYQTARIALARAEGAVKELP
jgi:outer membrane protein TolC